GIRADDLGGGGPGPGGISRQGPQRSSPQVNGKAVEAEFVYDRRVRDTYVGMPGKSRLAR
ncbi:MAG: hypothetical protein ACLP8X_22025, partial [Streptosporangiaceae bacterium]